VRYHDRSTCGARRTRAGLRVPAVQPRARGARSGRPRRDWSGPRPTAPSMPSRKILGRASLRAKALAPSESRIAALSPRRGGTRTNPRRMPGNGSAATCAGPPYWSARGGRPGLRSAGSRPYRAPGYTAGSDRHHSIQRRGLVRYLPDAPAREIPLTSFWRRPRPLHLRRGIAWSSQFTEPGRRLPRLLRAAPPLPPLRVCAGLTTQAPPCSRGLATRYAGTALPHADGALPAILLPVDVAGQAAPVPQAQRRPVAVLTRLCGRHEGTLCANHATPSGSRRNAPTKPRAAGFG